MAYQRFLTDNDYLSLITEEGLGQLIRGDQNRLAQAEQRAEMKIVDYLDQFYEIGKELEKGKRIKEYTNIVTYPSNVYFKMDGKIWRTIKSMNACHEPTSITYWENIEDIAMPAEQLRDVDNANVVAYLQQKTYHTGDMVSYLGATWRCLKPNGWDFQNIQIPGVTYWAVVESPEWVANQVYEKGDVVSYDDNFYAVTDTPSEDADWSKTPAESDVWGQIGTYDKGYDYTVDSYDYVVLDSVVYLPALSPNAEEPEENVNIVSDDPRNYNLVNYMTAIALYYLNALIAPTNISQTRIDMFNEAMVWIESAAKMKLDPHIPRKLDKKTKEQLDDWAMATFETNMSTQVNNPWFT